MKIIIALLLILIPVLSAAQPAKSAHQAEWEKHRNTAVHPQLLSKSSQSILPLQTAKSNITTSVFGYLPYWNGYSHLNFDLLSHIAVFGVNVNSDGSLGNDHGWPWTDLINTAHASGVKIILTAILFNGDYIHTLITTPAYRQNFFSNIKNKILEGGADGLNIDFESLNNADKGSNIVNFMQQLTDYLHNEIPGSEISFAGPAVNWGGYWDLPGLANACDYIFIMGYAFAGSWSNSSAANSPLAGGSYNISNTVNSQYGNVPGSKLILGIPYYGHHWVTVGNTAGSTVKNFEGSFFFKTAAKEVAIYGRRWHSASQTPWYRYFDGSNWHQVWYDDAQSLGLKYDLAESKGYKGIGMWALDYDGDRPELWSEIYERYGTGAPPSPYPPERLAVTSEDASTLRLDFDAGAFADSYLVELSRDGQTFDQQTIIGQSGHELTALNSDSLYFFRMKSLNNSGISAQTEVLAAVPSDFTKKVLIVNGFDRISGTSNTRDFIRQHAAAFIENGYTVSSCANEAVISGEMHLDDFAIVDWISGDESTVDETFNFTEQEKIKSFLQNGGKLFVSGSEIGWDLFNRGSSTDKEFYRDFFKAAYIEDAPNNQSGQYYRVSGNAENIFAGLDNINFDDGTHGTFNVDWPDVIKAIDGARSCFEYNGYNSDNGYAGITFEGVFPGGDRPGKLVYLAFPFESIYPQPARTAVMKRILSFFETRVSGLRGNVAPPEEFTLFPAYPNPFNNRINFNFVLRSPAAVRLEIFNLLGQKIFSSAENEYTGGEHLVLWQPGPETGSGTYFYSFFIDGKKSESGKIILFK